MLFSVFHSRKLQTPDADSRAEDKQEAAEKEKTRHRRKSTDTLGKERKGKGVWEEPCEIQSEAK